MHKIISVLLEEIFLENKKAGQEEEGRNKKLEKEEHRDETRLVRGTRVEYELEDKKEDTKMNDEKKDGGCLITILVSILTALVTNWVLKGWL